MKSRDYRQLRGFLDREPSRNCQPFAYINDTIPIAPCGAIANSMFTDEIELFKKENTTYAPVTVSKRGLVWRVDQVIKFINPTNNDTVEGLKKGIQTELLLNLPVFRRQLKSARAQDY